MRAISLFSGAGGFEIGFDRAGIETVLQVEIDPWCQTVLERHWPDVRRIDDVRTVGLHQQTFDGRRSKRSADTMVACKAGDRNGRQQSTTLDIDLIYGGFPCQDVSVAGNRAGLRGERSGLWSEFRRILSELRPRWTVIENVPGLLSSDGGRDFLRIIMDLDELGYGVAWRILDGRWFGVPQRRRRVFLVGCLGDAARAAQVLAVCESCGGHPQTSREAGEGIAATLSGGAHGAGVNLPGRHHEDDDNLVVAGTLGTMRRGYDAEEAWTNRLALPITNRQGIGNPDVQNFLVASPVRASDGHHGHSSGRGDGADNLIASPSYNGVDGSKPHGPQEAHAREVMRAVRDEVGAEAIREWAARGSWSLQAQEVLRSELYGEGVRLSTPRQPGLDGSSPPGTTNRGREDGVCALHIDKNAGRSPSGRELPEQLARELGRALSELSHETPRLAVPTQGVRRLTPLEAERLMGWPDDWTRYTADGREIPDSHRYRLCGNGVIATVAEWLGHRLMLVDRG